MPGLAEPIVRVLIVIPRKGEHVQVDAPDSGSGDDHGQNQHVEAKGAHGASQDGGGSTHAVAMERCRWRFLRLNQAMGCSASLSRYTGRFRVRDTMHPWLHRSGPSADLDSGLSFVLAGTDTIGGKAEALVSFWGEPFMAVHHDRRIPGYIIHVRDHLGLRSVSCASFTAIDRVPEGSQEPQPCYQGECADCRNAQAAEEPPADRDPNGAEDTSTG